MSDDPAVTTRDAGTAAADPQWFEQIGRLTRSLHESLRALGYDKAVDRAADALPDARDRLHYIASLTGQAADRTLTCIENAQPIQEALAQSAGELQARWAAALDAHHVPEPLRELLDQTVAYLREVPARTSRTNELLLDIMMAQDFHDLTGQVIKKVIELANDVEEQLIQLLLHSGYQRKAITRIDTQMNGPVIDPSIRTDAVDGQQQVDDLLDQLGF
ncbi:MAG: protein phosphatase CheZ [Burkholderiaceae bacterium]